MSVDKNQAVIDYLLTCTDIQENPLFFNFLTAQDKSQQIITTANDKALNQSYIDGSVLKRYTFSIIIFHTVSNQALPTVTGYSSENVQDIATVQAVMDWVNEQEDARNYPNFGTDCQIEGIRTSSENPNLNGVDTSVNPALAKYSMSIEIDYLDTSKCIWN